MANLDSIAPAIPAPRTERVRLLTLPEHGTIYGITADGRGWLYRRDHNGVEWATNPYWTDPDPVASYLRYVSAQEPRIEAV